MLVGVGLPLAVFAIPAALGDPWLVGDNLIQNFPLRVLVGTDLRAGHLPLWDPYVWSGSPLLAGFDAGAAYPLTWLFAALPRLAAWVAGQVCVEVVATSGMFVFLRLQRRSRTAAGLGALAFGYGGFLAMQSQHIDVVEAAGWLVWAFVALDRIAERPRQQPVAPWVALLGASLGLMVLSGSVEPVLDGGVALVLYLTWSSWRRPGRRLRIVGASAAGTVLGGLVGAVQLLPGSLLQSQSQRSLHSYSYFVSGSMNKSLTVLALDPLLLGGSHPTPLSYIGTYNLPEVCGYVGILPVMALVGLLAKRHRLDPESSSWWIWYLIAAVGLLLAWGGFTPLGHLEYLIPLYDRQRLLARNWLEVDLALCVLFAAWLDHMLLAPRGAGPPAGTVVGAVPGATPGRRGWRSDVVLPLVPVAAVVALQVLLLAAGPALARAMHVPGPASYRLLWPEGLVLTVPSAVAVTAGWLVAAGPRPGGRRRAFVVVVMAADLLFFNVMAQTDAIAGTAAGSSTQARQLATLVAHSDPGPGGVAPRYALYDPDRYYPRQVNEIGQPDLDVLRGLGSVQGYGPVVAAGYDDATGTHLQGNLDVGALAAGTFAGLDLGVLVVPPEYFVHLVEPPPGVAAGVPGSTALPPVPPDRHPAAPAAPAPPTPPSSVSAYLPGPAPEVALAAGQSRTFYFGTLLAVSAVLLPVTAAAGSGARVRVGLVPADGLGVDWLEGPPGVAAQPSLRVAAPGSPEAAGVVVEDEAGPGAPEAVGGRGSCRVGPAVVDTAGQGVYRLDSGLRDVVSAPRWRWVGTIADFGVFAEAPSGAAFVEPAAAGTARVISDSPWGTERIAVRAARAATLVRDVAYAPGWQAVVAPVDGPAHVRPVPVARHGLVQALAVPAGTEVVTFSYDPPRLRQGLVASDLGVVVCLLLVIAGRRKRTGPGRRRTPAAARLAAARWPGAPDGAGPGPRPIAPVGPSAPPPPRGP